MIKRALEESRFFGKSDTEYKIDLNYINVDRAYIFERLLASLSFNLTYSELLKRIDSVANVLGKPMETNQVISSNRQALEEIRNLQVSLNKFAENKVPPIIQFCCIFCVKENEDSELTNEMIKSKFEDWGHLPIVFFYQLSNTIARAYSEKKISPLSPEELKEIASKSQEATDTK